jgi:hypothetical protein
MNNCDEDAEDHSCDNITPGKLLVLSPWGINLLKDFTPINRIVNPGDQNNDYTLWQKNTTLGPSILANTSKRSFLEQVKIFTINGEKVGAVLQLKKQYTGNDARSVGLLLLSNIKVQSDNWPIEFAKDEFGMIYSKNISFIALYKEKLCYFQIVLKNDDYNMDAINCFEKII